MQLISTLQKFGIPILAYGPGNPENLLRWGERYYSVPSGTPNSDTYPTEFIIYFPYTPISVKTVRFYITTDVFPTKWSVLVSSDNITYIPIVESEEALCEEKYQNTTEDFRIMCNVRHPVNVPILKEQPISYSYFKFKLIENTYFDDHIYQKLIVLRGIELIGDFYIKFPISPKIHTPFIRYSFLLFSFFLRSN